MYLQMRFHQYSSTKDSAREVKVTDQAKLANTVILKKDDYYIRPTQERLVYCKSDKIDYNFI